MKDYRDAYGNLVIMQPAYDYPTMQTLGLEFAKEDSVYLARYDHIKAADLSAFVPGVESKHNVLCRIFVIHEKGKKPRVIGGLATAMSGRIVHGSNRAANYALYCQGVRPYAGIRPYHNADLERLADRIDRAQPQQRVT
jgi:hypothetical protein